MPIYEYDCAACGEGFELLVRSDTAVACPRCASSRVERKLSVTAVARGAAAAPACDMPDPPAGGCCGGGCGFN